MKQVIKLDFSDFWPGFDKEDNYFVNLLREHYDIQITGKPDFLIYSNFGQEYRKYRCIRIFYTGDCIQPDFNECDYSFDFEFIDRPEHYRLPHYALYGDPESIVRSPSFDPMAELRKKSGFCSFVVSNPRGKERNEFFRKLSEYKKVDSGGRFENNVNGPIVNKLEFVRQRKFAIAFENQGHPGYTTEKIFQPMQVHSVPIYWGNPLAHLDFNPRCFIDAHEFSGLDTLVEHVAKVDQDDGLYLEYLRQPCYNGNVVNTFVRPKNVRRQFDHIFTTSKQPVAITHRYRAVGSRMLRSCRKAFWSVRARMQEPA